MSNSINNQQLKSKTITGFIWRFSERLASHFISFVVTLVLARLLMPDDYGIVALAMVFVNIANVFISSGLNTSLIQKKDVDDVDYSTIFYATAALSIVVYGLLYVGAPSLAKLYDNNKIADVLRVLGLILPLSSFNAIQQAIVSRNLNFKYFFIATFISAILAGALGIALAFYDFGVWALVCQQLSNIAFNTIALYSIVKWHPQQVFSFERLKQMLGFGVNLMLANFIGAIFNQLRNFLVGTKYTPSDLAYMTTGDSFPSLISNNIDASINTVLFPALSKVQNSKTDVRRGMRRAMMISSYLVVPALFLLIAVADHLVLVLLTDKWIFCIPYLRILSLGYCFSVLSNANLQTFNAIGRSDITFKLEFIKKPVLLMILLGTMQISPFAIAIGTTVYGIVALIVNLYPNKKLIDYGIIEQLKDVIPQFLISIIVAFLVYSIGFIDMNITVLLLIQILTGVFMYILISFSLRLESFLYLKSLVKEYKSKFEND